MYGRHCEGVQARALCCEERDVEAGAEEAGQGHPDTAKATVLYHMRGTERMEPVIQLANADGIASAALGTQLANEVDTAPEGREKAIASETGSRREGLATLLESMQVSLKWV